MSETQQKTKAQMPLKNTVHIVAQGKGGGGKSLVALTLLEFMLAQGIPAIGFDLDPINQTFSNVKGLGAIHYKITNQNNGIDKGMFDGLIEKILETEEPIILDNGSSNFSAIMEYLVQGGAVELLTESGKEVIFHAPIMGGDFFNDMFQTLDMMMEHFQTAKFVSWENEFKGVLGTKVDGVWKNLEDLELYQNPLIVARPRIKHYDSQTHGRDLIKKGQACLSFAEAIASQDFGAMERNRLKMIWKDLKQAASIATGIQV